MFRDEGDLEAARELVAAAPQEAELFLYDGDAHLFSDPSVPGYDAAAAATLASAVRTAPTLWSTASRATARSASAAW